MAAGARAGPAGPTVRWHRDDGVAWVEFSRPAVLNALRVEELTALLALITDRRADRPDALVLHGGVGGSFSSGFDVKAVLADPAGQVSRHAILQSCIAALADAPFSTVAVIRGYCLGAALDLALVCDFRIADEQSIFGMPAPSRGVLYDVRSIGRIRSQFGAEAARALFLANRHLTAAEAAGLGLLTEVYAGEQQMPATLARWLDSSRKVDGDLLVQYRRQITQLC
jgi:enoyl-CoA hydratase/carnithine racemase